MTKANEQGTQTQGERVPKSDMTQLKNRFRNLEFTIPNV